MNREFEAPKCREYGPGVGKLDPIDGPYLDVMVQARLTLKAERPDLFGARSQGWQVLDNREYQAVLVATINRDNPDICALSNPAQDDETLLKERGIEAVAPASSWHYDHLFEGDGKEPNEAGEFLAASCSPPWF